MTPVSGPGMLVGVRRYHEVQRHIYSVTVVDRQTGAESQRRVEAISAADAEAIVGQDSSVFVGRAVRADGAAEVSGSPYDRVSYFGYHPSDGIEDEVRMELEPSVARVRKNDQGTDQLSELIAIARSTQNRLIWFQRFGVWTFWVLPTISGGIFALIFALNMRDFGMSWKEILLERDSLISMGAFVCSLIGAAMWLGSIRRR